MTCPDPARLSAAASGEDLVVEDHAASCPSCHHTLAAERSLRALAARLPAPTLSTDRRRALEATILALAERTPPASRPARRLGRFASEVIDTARVRSLRRATLLATALLAAAALLTWRLLPRSAHAPAPHAAAPLPPPPAPTVIVALDGADVAAMPPPSIVAATGTRFVHRARTDRDEIVLTDGTLAIDSTINALSLSDTAPTPIAIHADGARLEVRATAGAIHSVQVFAGSVEVVHHGRTIVVTAGATWTPSEDRTPDTRIARSVSEDRTPDTRIARSVSEDRTPDTRIGETTAFATAWKALHAGDLTAAAAGFAQASADPIVGEDASYWLAATHARAGNSALAIHTYDAFLTTYPTSPHAGAAHLALARLLATADPPRAAHHRDRAAADVDPRIRASAVALEPRP